MIPASGVKETEDRTTSSNSSTVKISVVVATFNRRESLRQLLESLANQTLSPTLFEVVIVSDGSTDGTAELVRELSMGRKNLKLLEMATLVGF